MMRSPNSRRRPDQRPRGSGARAGIASSTLFDRLAWIERDRLWATRINRAADHPLMLPLLGVVSRLGDGVLWYSIMLALPFLDGRAGRLAATHMAVAGILCVTLYWVVKRWAARERPYTCCQDIRLCSRPLDRFSFPSGHTLHAVAFTAVIVAHYPSAGWVLWPFTALVAVSRVALGLHYPSDVLAGAAIGATVATLVLLFAL
jgi:undecaprenyl-diphosphatase